MPCPHNEISIVQRSQQQSAVAAAAYQSGEKLFCEYDQQVKHYPEKRGMRMNFNHEEKMLLILYNPGTRLGLVQELRLMQCYLMPDETALRELSESVIEKLKLMTDSDFAEIEFSLD